MNLVRRVVASHLTLSLALTAVVFSIGAAQKAACANADWVDRRVGPGFQCYSDIADLRRTEQLLGDRLPYLQECARQDPRYECDEYPVASMYTMRFAAWAAGGGGDPYHRFYWVNAALLLACALLATGVIERLGGRSMLFAGAPVLAMYGTMNWDLIPVALSTSAIAMHLRSRATGAGILLGLGTAFKVYPALLLIAVAYDAFRRRAIRASVHILAGGVGIWLLINVPFALSAFDGWARFFRFNSDRAAEYDSLWRVACSLGVCAPTALINVASITLTVVGARWYLHRRRRLGGATPEWTIALPLLTLFVVTNKVWSPQYSLWLLPLFALLAPSFRSFLAWQATEVFVYIARFSFFAELASGDPSYTAFSVAVVLRAAALIWCLEAWIRDRTPPPSVDRGRNVLASAGTSRHG